MPCCCPCGAWRSPACRGASGRAGQCRERPHVPDALAWLDAAAVQPHLGFDAPSGCKHTAIANAVALLRAWSLPPGGFGARSPVARNIDSCLRSLGAPQAPYSYSGLARTMQAQGVRSACSAASRPQAAACSSWTWRATQRLAAAPRQQAPCCRRTAAAAAAGSDIAASPTPGIKPDATSIIGNTPMVSRELAAVVGQACDLCRTAGHRCRAIVLHWWRRHSPPAARQAAAVSFWITGCGWHLAGVCLARLRRADEQLEAFPQLAAPQLPLLLRCSCPRCSCIQLAACPAHVTPSRDCLLACRAGAAEQGERDVLRRHCVQAGVDGALLLRWVLA